MNISTSSGPAALMKIAGAVGQTDEGRNCDLARIYQLATTSHAVIKEPKAK
jgi:hypothetical protein